MMQLTSAREQLRQLRSGEITAEQLVTEALQCLQTNQHLNAFLAIEAESALAQARRVDRARAAGNILPPLAGLPICVKDNIDLAGWVTSGATKALAQMRVGRTAPVLQCLLDAGAIVLGKTNLHELAFGITNVNFSADFPTARNPANARCITGGSSGGTAAAIAAGIVTAGLGTDTSGSIRIPAALCGIAGFRPSVGNGGDERHYSTQGVLPISHSNDTVGPMAATVHDLALLDGLIRGDAAMPECSINGLRLGVPDCFWDRLDPEVETICRDFCERLAANGALLVNVSLPDLRDTLAKISVPVVLHEPLQDIPAYLREIGLMDMSLQDLCQNITNPDVKAAFDAILAEGFGDAYGEAIAIHRPALRQIYQDVFSSHSLDALIFPTVPVPAVAIDQGNAFASVEIGQHGTFSLFETCIRNTDPAANAGLPGLSLPVGRTRGGLPVGIELDAMIGQDRHLLAIGCAIERLQPA